MHSRQLGTTGPEVYALGLALDDRPRDDAAELDMRAALRAGLDAGVTLLDTADFHGAGRDELTLADFLHSRNRRQVVVSVTFGERRDLHGQTLDVDVSPAAVKSSLAYSLTRLRTDYIDIYRPARLSPDIPIEETIGAIADLVHEGWVRYVGLPSVDAATIRRAHAAFPISDVRLDYSLLSRGMEVEILPTCQELGIGVTATNVLAGGLLGRNAPAGEAGAPVAAVLDRMRTVAAQMFATLEEVAIAWVLSRGRHVVPIIDAVHPTQLAYALPALHLELTPDQVGRISALVPEHHL